jgi:hypothetical protein
VVLSAIDESLKSAIVLIPAEFRLPVKFPLKVPAVATPVITTPSGNVGASPAFLPLRLVTLKSDIRGLRVVEHQ